MNSSGSSTWSSTYANALLSSRDSRTERGMPHISANFALKLSIRPFSPTTRMPSAVESRVVLSRDAVCASSSLSRKLSMERPSAVPTARSSSWSLRSPSRFLPKMTSTPRVRVIEVIGTRVIRSPRRNPDALRPADSTYAYDPLAVRLRLISLASLSSRRAASSSVKPNAASSCRPAASPRRATNDAETLRRLLMTGNAVWAAAIIPGAWLSSWRRTFG